MTKLLPAVPATSFFVARLASAVVAVLLGLPGYAQVQSQGLRPSAQLRTTPSAPAVTRQADYIVAVVNSEPITGNELRAAVVRTEQQMAQQGAPMPPRSDMQRLVLERLINDRAQLQLARASGLKIDDNALQSAVQTVARQNQLSINELRKRLAADGIAYSKFQSNLKDELLLSRLRQREVEGRVAVTDLEVDQFLREQQNTQDAGSAMLSLAEILIAVPENASAAQAAALQAKAQAVSDRAAAGADFAALAGEVSSAASRSAGGQLGLRSADRYPPLFVQATQSLRVGDVTGPVRSQAGFHVLKVLEKKANSAAGAVVSQTRVRHILLRLSNQQTEEGAVNKLAAYKKSIIAGRNDFAALARDISEDGSAQDGGDLGWTSPGVFVPEFEKVMDSLALNQISEPLVSRFGVHLLEVTERRDAKLTEREQREAVRGQLREKKTDEAYLSWTQDVRGRAYVELRELLP